MTHALHLTTWHPYVDGVSGAFVLEQCSALDTSGVRSGIIFSRIEGLRALKPGRLLRGFPGFVRLERPVPTVGFKSWNVPGMRGFTPRFNQMMLQNRYAAYVRKNGKPDILHAHVALETGLAARRIAEKSGLGYVITEHSSEILNGNLTRQKIAVARQVYHDAKCVIAVSEVLADCIDGICPTARIKIVPNLVRECVFSLRQPRGTKKSKFLVVSVGGLAPDKRTHHAIAALAMLPDAIKTRVEHQIIGDGPDRGKLEAQALAGGVPTEFLGNLPHQQAMKILAGGDLLLHASAYETFGVVVAEAMALGLPQVVTRSGGPEGIVTPDTGILVAVDDIEALQNAVAVILQDIEMWRARSDSIANCARQRYHETKIASAIVEAYR